jgi:uncharacterized membrane protein
MPGGGSELMLLGMLVCTRAFPLLLVGGGWVVARLLRTGREQRALYRPWETLSERLAAGEIDVEEYYEREAALRSIGAAPAARDRRRTRSW